MRFLFYFLTVVFLFTAQITLYDFIDFAAVTLSLPLIFAFFCATYFSENSGIFVAGLIGFIQDCLSGGILGVNTLSKSLIGFFISTLQDKILVNSFIPLSLCLAATSFFDGIIFYVFSSFIFKGQFGQGVFLNQLIIYSLINAFLGPLLFQLFNFYDRRRTSKGYPRSFKFP